MTMLGMQSPRRLWRIY